MSRQPPHSSSWFQSLRIWTVALAVGWTATIAILLGWEHHEIRDRVLNLAVVDAQASFEQDLAFRRWAAHHGGVYVPVTPETPPNPYLAHVPERDLTTPSGRALTLMNSAYISRQLHEWYSDPKDTRRHVTSLRPLRPENGPDAWEAAALKALEQGSKEVVSQEMMDGRSYMRLMRPMVTEAQCLKCHAVQGYQVGDIRGGISVSVPMTKYESVGAKARAFSSATYSGIWLLGLAGIGTGGWALHRKAMAQRSADQARLNSERKFRAIFDQAFHLSGVLSPDGKVLEINSCALDFAGAAPGDVLGKPFWECVWWSSDPAAAARVREAIGKAALDGLPTRFETTHVDRHGRRRHIDFSLRPVKDEAGRALFLVPEGNDVTDRKEAEETHRRLTEKLAQAQRLELIGRLAGGVAHDFNNMISPIMGYTDILLAGKAQHDPDRHALEEIMAATVRARDLTQQLLACGRQESLHTRRMDLNETILGFRNALRHTLRDNITIETRLAPALAAIEGDPRQVEQILLNLAINAGDAMPEGGRLTIETSSIVLDGEDPRLNADWRAGGYVLLTVSDTGSGMDKHVVQRIFEPFFTTKPDGKGTGLGLPTVYGIVNAHGGQIEVDSEPGRGTVFRLYFPQAS